MSTRIVVHHQHKDNQDTPPIQVINPFQAYLSKYKLTWVEVARASSVPVLTVWSIDHGLIVESTQAARVCEGLYRLTGIAYAGPINTTKE